MIKNNKWERIGSLVLGNAILAFLVAAFVIPHGIITGGGTGIGIVVGRALSIDPAAVVLVFNIAMLILGWFSLGKQYCLSTVVGSLIYPLFLDSFDNYKSSYITSGSYSYKKTPAYVPQPDLVVARKCIGNCSTCNRERCVEEC